MPFFERSKITVQQRHLFKNIFSYGRFRYAFTLCKKVFSAAPVKWFFLYGSNNSDSVVFGECRFWNCQRSKFENNTFSKKKKKKKCYGGFRYVSTLLKKVFSGAPVKCVFLCGSNNSDSVVFRNAGWTTTLKKNCCERFVYVSTLLRKIFLGALVKCFFLYDSNNSDSVVFGMSVLERSKITAFLNILNILNIFFRISNSKQCAFIALPFQQCRISDLILFSWFHNTKRLLEISNVKVEMLFEFQISKY